MRAMDHIEKDKENLILFTKVGAIVLTSLLLLATSIYLDYGDGQFRHPCKRAADLLCR